MHSRSRAGLAAVLLVGLAAAAGAHDLALTESRLLLGRDGTWRLEMVCDLDALALGVAPGSDSAQVAAALRALPPEERAEREERLRELFRRRVRVLFDGEASPFEVSFVREAPPGVTLPEGESELGLVARLEGAIPAPASEVSMRASRSFPPVHLTVVYERLGEERRQLLEQGAPSDPLPLRPPPPPGRWSVALRYLRLGAWHILPEGPDHVLFVLGLFLLSPRLRPLLIQVSAFTLAHTLTLGLAASGVLVLPPRAVEPLIALSIAWVAIENTLTDRLRAWRPAVVFGFGLIHGLGFAGVLGGLGLPAGERLSALLAFNAGVELGQLAVLALAFATLGPFRRAPWYRRRLVVPLSLAIASAGVVWAVQRVSS